MLLHVASLGDQPSVGAAEILPVSEAEPLVLSLELLADELLDGASLVLRRTTSVGPAPRAGISSTSSGGSLVGVEWVSASWDRTQAVTSLSLSFASKPSPLVVRVSIARGGGAWHSPPGPHTFTLGAAMELNATLPDTVADRVLVEFLDPQGAAATVDLSEVEPLTVRLGREPRDLDLRVRGGRPLLRWTGAIPEGAGFIVDDLRPRLEAELEASIRNTTVELELRAAVAGELSLDWSFTTVRIGERFPDGSTTRMAAISWGDEVEEPLLLAGATPVHLEALALSVAARPVAEQMVLAPTTGSTSGVGQLVRPLHEAAQALPMLAAWSLTGVDIFARTLVDNTSITLALHPDTKGRPAASPSIELTRVIEARMPNAGWLVFDIPSPLSPATGTWWLVARVDEGELVWTTRPDQGLLHRRDRSQWLSRDGWGALVRVRAAAVAPAQPLTLWLRGEQADLAGAPWELPLTLGDDGAIRWSSGSVASLPSRALSLRIGANVATSVVLSNLQLRYRPNTP